MKWFVLAVMVLFVAPMAFAATPYGSTTCANTDITNEVYLQTDVYGLDADTCFIVHSGGVLDCRGHTIYPYSEGHWSLIDLHGGGEVRNCVLQLEPMVTYGVLAAAIYSSQENVLFNNTFVRTDVAYGTTIEVGDGAINIDRNRFIIGSIRDIVILNDEGVRISNNVFDVTQAISTQVVIRYPQNAVYITNNTFNISDAFQCNKEFGDATSGANVFNNYYVGECGEAQDYSLTCQDADNDGLCDFALSFAQFQDPAPRVFGWEPVPPCTPAWSCDEFASCSELNVSACVGVVDANACGEEFGGSLSTYDEACVFVPPVVEENGTAPVLPSNPLAIGGGGGSGAPAPLVVPQSSVGVSADTSGIRAFFAMLWDWIIFWR